MTTVKAGGIEVNSLTRVFGDLTAVAGIDLVVKPGEIYGFLGPNGAGKTTTVHMLTTLLPPTAGHARVGGFDVVEQAAAVRRTIGAALQEVALDPVLTGREHMRLQAALQGLPRREWVPRGEGLLDRVGLLAAADRKAGVYSGGMKRRLDLAMALLHRPSILFLDEPTTGLDPQSRSALWDEVARLAREEGVTIFLTTHYLEEADVLADRISIIDQGRLVAEGTPAALKAEIGRPSVEVVPGDLARTDEVSDVLTDLGDPEPGRPGSVRVRLRTGVTGIAEVVRHLDAAGLEVAQLEWHAPTLDDVFLSKTGRHLEGAEQAVTDEREAPAAPTAAADP